MKATKFGFSHFGPSMGRFDSTLSDFGGHNLRLIRNDSFVSDDGRHKIHFILWCRNCKEEKVVRGHLAPEYTDFERQSALAKLICLGHFHQHECV